MTAFNVKNMTATLPTINGNESSFQAEIYYLWNNFPNKITHFVNGVPPNGFLHQDEMEKEYYDNLDSMAKAFKNELNFNFDTLLMPSTSRQYTINFKDKFTLNNTYDISPFFEKKDSMLRFSEETDFDINKMYKNILVKEEPEFNRINRLLFIDDVIRDGRTLSIYINLLKSLGLKLDCQIKAVSILCFINT